MFTDAESRGHTQLDLGTVANQVWIIFPLILQLSAHDFVFGLCSPAIRSVCGSPSGAFQKLAKDAIAQLSKLESGSQEQETFDYVRLKWTKEALIEIRSVPDGYQVRRAKARIEKRATVQRVPTITLGMVRAVLAGNAEELQNLTPRGHMKMGAENADGSRETPTKKSSEDLIQDGAFLLARNVRARLRRAPEGVLRTHTKERIEAVVRASKANLSTLAITEEGIRDGIKLMEEWYRLL